MGALARLPWWRRPGRKDRAEAAESLAMVGLSDRAGDTFGDMSGGQRQRALIARALTADANLLLLDEPYTGLDSASAKLLDRLIDELAAQGRSVMVATHDVEQAARLGPGPLPEPDPDRLRPAGPDPRPCSARSHLRRPHRRDPGGDPGTACCRPITTTTITVDTRGDHR